MSVFINRSLNLEKIKAIGLDMDHTLVRYHTVEFEKLTHTKTKERLVSDYGYPEEINSIDFDFDRVIQGLVIDNECGNLLKISKFDRVKLAIHGQRVLSKEEVRETYHNYIIDIKDERFTSLDTNFSISQGSLFSQLVELKNQNISLPDFKQISSDVKEAIDINHRDGTLKRIVRENIERYIVKDDDIIDLLKSFKNQNKKLMVITNSDFEYTKLILDYCINSYGREKWNELFDLVITSTRKPRFFMEKRPFMEIDLETEKKKLVSYQLDKGIFEGGHAGKLQQDLGLNGDEILYIGDHIYGDVVSLKKNFNWRTALVLGPLEKENLIQAENMEKFNKLNNLQDERLSILERGEDEVEIDALVEKAHKDYRRCFNQSWGQLMRARFEESYFAGQVERFACLYMPSLRDFLKEGPDRHYRPYRKLLPHESR